MTNEMTVLCLRALVLSAYALVVALAALVKVIRVDHLGTQGGRDERARNGGA